MDKPEPGTGATIGGMQVRYLARSDATGDAIGIYAVTLAARSPGAGLHRHARSPRRSRCMRARSPCG